jgi:outer membrane protein
VSTVIPLVGYLGERLTWLGPYLNYRLRDADDAGDGFDVNLTAALRFQGFSYDGDDPRLVGLADRDVALDVGGSIARDGVKLELMADVTGTHDGFELALSYAHDLRLNRRTTLTLSGNVAWLSENLIDYYYGVSPQEATPTRAAYAASAGTNIGVGANLNVFITRQWMLMARARVTALADDITDSPIVEDDYETSAMFGIVYRFGGN